MPAAHALSLTGFLGHSLRELSQLRDTALRAQQSGHDNFYFLGLRITQLFLMTENPCCSVSISTTGFLLRLVDARPHGAVLQSTLRGDICSSSMMRITELCVVVAFMHKELSDDFDKYLTDWNYLPSSPSTTGCPGQGAWSPTPR